MADHRAPGRAEGSPIVFAIRSINNVQKIAQAIIKSGKLKATPFCRNLCSALDGVTKELQRPKQSQDEAQLKKVKSLLNNLERLCNWPCSSEPKAIQWPTLKAIRSATWKQEAAEAAQISDASATSPAPHNRHELDDDIQYLYRILEKYRSCQIDSSPGDIVINLRLNGYRNLAASGASVEILAENASAEFGVLLLDHPHKDQGFWQEASIQTVSPSGPGAPTIQVTDEDVAPGAMDTLAMEAVVGHDCIPFESFCERISNRDQGLLRMSTRDDKLVYHRPGDLSREWLPHVEAVPLASILRQKVNLTEKSKAILGMLVAKATWEFYDSDLLAQGLTSETVQFICEKRFGITGVFINEPMLLTQFTKKDGTSIGDDKSDSRLATPSRETIHDMPLILALGILLLELETENTMMTHRENRRLCPPGPFGINTDYKIACKLIATEPHARDSIISEINPSSPLRKILPLCITPGSFERKIRENLSAQGLTKFATQSEMVRPLEDWAKRYDDFDRIQPLYEVSAAPARHRPERLPIQPQTTSQAKHSANVKENQLREDSRDWFQRYEKLRNVLQPTKEEKKSGYKAVKIAVLDTGISDELYKYYIHWPDKFKYVDFVDTARQDQDPASDSTEHGSAAVLLLEEMYPDANYCVARVLKENVAMQADAEKVAKGIDWAISQKVDIITMAIGFKLEQDAVVKAVGRAHTQGILIFSAASNNRRVDDVCCPANMAEQVFAIFSTDAGICQSRSLNPAPLPGTWNFAIFGEGVEVKEGRPLRSGTSYSTSVAAGLAALLLDFSRQDRDENDGSIFSRLGSRPYMQSVFREMAVTDNEYLCLRPWKLLKTGEVPRKQQRDWIRGTIERLLQPNQLRRAG
ncbi:hypothetical protein BDP67DRAFT_582282 [Colletotrichum lupini]|nr:hypothetical protein BDP67DRAFT_582282 [Colletotrichum lupini]